MEEVTRLELELASIKFFNYPNDSRGRISNAEITFKTFGGPSATFQISSDTATYRQILAFFRKYHAGKVNGVYDAAPTRTRLP